MDTSKSKREQILDTIYSYLKDMLDIKEDDIDTLLTFDDLGLTRLCVIEIIMELEFEFNIRIPDTEINLNHTIDDLVNVVETVVR